MFSSGWVGTPLQPENQTCKYLEQVMERTEISLLNKYDNMNSMYLNNVKLLEKSIVNTSVIQEDRQDFKENVDFGFIMF